MKPPRLAFLLPLCAMLFSTQARAQDLAAALNAFRAQPAACPGGRLAGAPPLRVNPQLAQVAAALAALGDGAQPDLNAALNRVGYRARKSVFLRVSGLAETAALASYADRSFCDTLRGADFSEIGIHQQGAGSNTRTFIILTQPMALPASNPTGEADLGRRVLALANQARASARSCGPRRFAPAPPLAWNDLLAQASLAHASDMAQYQYFSHAGRDGSQAGQRAQRAGYAWKAVGENIAAGQSTPEEVVAGWIASPGHCANLMSPAFSAMGVAYAVNPSSRMGIYWAQVFGAPR